MIDIEANGTEIAIVIAVVTGTWLIRFTKDVEDKGFRLLRRTLKILLVLSVLSYAVMRSMGVNP